MYKLTGYHSHRHPFYGYGFGDERDIPIDLDKPLAPGLYEALAADEVAAAAAAAETPAPTSWAAKARPFINGAVTGMLTYATCRTFDVDKKKALQVSFVLGGVNLIFGLVSDYLYREMQAIAADQVKEAKA